jgi:hypothetical protein
MNQIPSFPNNHNDWFRLSKDDLIRILKRSPWFRHALIAQIEMHDPFEPDRPFIARGLLPELENEYYFSRNNIPAYLLLWTGKAARQRIIEQVHKGYQLPAAQRYQEIERDFKFSRYNREPDSDNNPDQWEIELAIYFEFPDNSGAFGGTRERALAHPVLRKWLLDPQTRVLHGPSAIAASKDMITRCKAFQRPIHSIS